jgi:pectate lyase
MRKGYVTKIIALSFIICHLLFSPARAQFTSQNPQKNQAVLTLKDGSRKYYDTETVESIDVEGADITIHQQSGSYTYKDNVTSLAFNKGNTENKVVITEAKGWLESAYVKFTKLAGISKYNVYVNGKTIDTQLVRDYGTYGRADAVGLAAGTYSVKVVPVGDDGKEFADCAGEATDISVRAINRDGYAHYNTSDGIGAYNNDGTLKTGARVLYVTKNNAKTVTLSMNVGKKEEIRTGIQDILKAYEKGAETRPLAIRIIGQLRKADMPELGSSAIGLQVKGKSQNMNLTIEGIGNDATLHGFGVLCRNCRYVELRNFAVMMHPEDGISFDTNNEHIWGHHLDIFYGENKGGDKAKGDGSFDVKGTLYCTVSDNHFWDSGKCHLNSNGDEVDFVSYHHNWYDHSDSRHPRVRKSQHLHVFNNYFDGNSKYGVGATTGSCIFVEKNYYRNCKYPMLISKQGSDIHNGVGSSDQTKGTFSSEDGGMIKAYDNYMTGQTSFEPYVAGDATYGKHFDAYVVTNREDQVPAEVVTLKGGTGYNNFDTSSDFYTYTPDQVNDVPSVVTGHYGAGRCEHGDFQYTFDNATQDKNADVISDLSDKLKNYDNTAFIGIFSEE